MNVYNITKDSYKNEVENFNGTVLIDFFADCCAPCKKITPVIEKISENSPQNVKICKVNVEKEADLAKRFGIMSIPTVVVLKDGKIRNRSIGVTGEKAILDMLE